MSTETTSTAKRLEQIEQRLKRLERDQQQSQQRDQIRRRQAFWSRVALGGILVLAYVLYHRFLGSLMN